MTPDTRQHFEKTLAHIAPTGVVLSRTKEGAYAFRILRHHTNGSISLTNDIYTRAELDDIDPRLARVVELVGDRDLTGSLVASIAYWKALPLPKFILWEDARPTQYAVTKILDVRSINNETKTVQCNCHCYELVTTCELDYDYAFCTYEHVIDELPFAWVEQYYPGATGKMRAALNLGLTPAEIAAYTFDYAASEQPAVLPTEMLPT